ncbi:hypothetical protein G5714_006957 [Onychostoma macrolepis]|uniref:Uncharacterized protein n=1 Tax=Onychostoma macrolepis TaxID=369639 RepID=A0A7J6CZ11_9TELE|nr:hypothetical protein G5714_006957 [Onychostoma macrolepis]
MFVHVEKAAKAWEACWSPCEIEEDRKVSSHRTSCFDGGGHGREPEMFIQCACISVFGVDASVFTDGLPQGLGTGWDINHSLTGKVPPSHFLLDLAVRHFQVSNYHYGAKATPTALQHGVLASP